MDLEKKLERIQGCIKTTDSKEEFERCVAPMTLDDVRDAAIELTNALDLAEKTKED